MLLSGTVTAEAQMKSFSPGMFTKPVSPRNHTPYYLPYYDQRHWVFECLYFNLCRYDRNRRYEDGYWYPWFFLWGRYDEPNERWWTFSAEFFDEYGTGGIWKSREPSKGGELKAIQTIERERMAALAMRESPRSMRGSGFRSTGISSSRGSSISSSGGGSSIGSSGGGSAGGKRK
jgi:uncharacterized membrane protein YgcG